ncbi:MAG TPA: hypothetical protein VH234_03980 [Candidatus Saccharimonadales bacterium]|jgi:hypothetical protein|nr:hypothetical protein [Candidatus Saccharimonadales bacterium]
MDDAKTQLLERLKSANNILVTVSRNPSVDQLAACLGLALLLNKDGKHIAAVFSGQVPSTLEFLKPEETLEKNTDSLRDFIIALDKSKADKLRYKVEDNVVRIFITPYKTSISQTDLDFSQGDFNVDLVVALGVSQQEDLDQAITTHGRILHDATVASVNITGEGNLGGINWKDPQASSLSELMTELAQALGPNLLDEQIATALLTGIVSATERFSNDKTTSQTMSASAALMAAGANQQLVASKLEQPEDLPPPLSSPGDQSNQDSDDPPDGTIEIEHGSPTESDHKDFELPAPDDNPITVPAETPALVDPAVPVSNPSLTSGSRLMSQPPSMGGTLTANTQAEGLDPMTDPLSLPAVEPPQLLERKPADQFTPPPSFSQTSPLPTIMPDPAPEPPPLAPAPPIVPTLPTPEPPAPEPKPEPVADSPTPEPVLTPPPTDDKPIYTPPVDASSDLNLSELEEKVKQSETKDSSLDAVRDEVSKALTSSASGMPQPPIEALNAQPLGEDLHPADPVKPTSDDTATSMVTDPAAPPPVPPPIPFQFGNPSQQ